MLWAELREAFACMGVALLATIGVAAVAGGLCAGLYFVLWTLTGGAS